MIEKIGNVTMNYQFYKGADLYSDGEIEDWMLRFAQQGQIEKALWANTQWPIFYHFTPIRENIIDWYPIKQGASVLEIGAGCGAITGILSRRAQRVVCIELSKKRSLINAHRNKDYDNIEIMVGNYEDIELEEKFDYITLIGVLEYAEYYIHSEHPAQDMLRQLRAMLKPDGKILIAIENRMGLKYLNGASEDHTGGLFDSLYQYHGRKGVRTYTKPELEHLLRSAGFLKSKFYYPLPDYKLPRMILSDDSRLYSGFMKGMMTAYDRDRFVFFEEDMVWDTLCRDGALGYLSNSFMVEACSGQSMLSNIESVFYAIAKRNAEYMTCTKIYTDGSKKTAVKSALRSEGGEHVESFLTNYESMDGLYKSIRLVPPVKTAQGIEFAFIEGKNIHDALLERAYDKENIKRNVQLMLDRVLDFNEDYITEFYITEDFINVFGKVSLEGVPAVVVANIDSTFSNLCERDGELYCFDYEWVFHFPVPVAFIRYRMLGYWYVDAKEYLPYQNSEEFFMDFGFTEQEILVYGGMDSCFINYVSKGKKGYQYEGQYVKSGIRFFAVSDAIEQMGKEQRALTEEKEQLEKAYDELAAEKERLERKLDMHMRNEERLRGRLVREPRRDKHV